MAAFKVTRNYRSNHNGRHFAYDKGAEVDVEPDVAEWVNRDSPGTLKPVGKSEPKSEPSSADEPPRAGKGSGTKAWAEYASSLGLDLPADASRDDIIAAVDAAKNGDGDG